MKRSIRTGFIIGSVLVATVLVVTACQTMGKKPAPGGSQQLRHEVPMTNLSMWKTVRLTWDFAFNKPADTQPLKPVPVDKVTREQLLAAPDRSLFRLGHSTILLKLRGGFWLTDPVFSDRASPVQWTGPLRFHQTPISVNDLPPIKGVLFSHDHYDHLDRAAVLELAKKTGHFYAPLGVGDILLDWGVDPAKVQQFDWWQETEADGLRVIATPAQHFSGRGVFDGNKTLWASWVMIDDDLRIYFSGDSGYFDGYKTIGDKYGPFAITLMETGAYGKEWPLIHMHPEETVQAHLDLKGKWLLPIHNGTFDLGMHTWYDPFERITALGVEKGVSVTTPRMGEVVNINAPHAGTHWWTAVK